MLRSTHSRDLRDADFLGKSDLHVVAAVEDGEAHSSATSGFCESGARQAIPAAAASAGADSGAQAATERGVHTEVTAASTNLSAHDDESRAPARDELEDSAIGRALLATPTSNSWSMLDAVAAKVSRRLRRRISARELDSLMVRAGDAALRRHGVWRTSFGSKYMPIVLINPAFARTVAGGGAASTTCSCEKRPGATRGVRGGQAQPSVTLGATTTTQAGMPRHAAPTRRLV
mgnify:CR=1 FL=1